MKSGPVEKVPGTVLVVEDDELAGAQLSDLLAENRCRALVARSAEEAESLLSHGPMMALIDVTLPGQQGDQLCRRLRMDRAFWDLPVVMVTSSNKSDLIRRCFLAGADDFLPKPARSHEVRAKIDAVLAGLHASARTKPPDKAVLVATQDSGFSQLMSRLLEAGGYSVLHQSTVAGAVKVLADSPALHAAILDADLGGGGGELLKAFRSTPAYPRLAVVAVTRQPALLAAEPDLAGIELVSTEHEPEGVLKRLNDIISARSAKGRRGNPRVALQARVDFKSTDETEWLAGYGYDLSESGLFIRTLTPLSATRQTRVRFCLSDDDEPLELEAKVSWNNPYGPRSVFSYPCGMGVAFTDLTPGVQASLRNRVRSGLGAKKSG